MCSIFLRVAGFACSPASLTGVVCCNSVWRRVRFLRLEPPVYEGKLKLLLASVELRTATFHEILSQPPMFSKHVHGPVHLWSSRSSARRVLRRGASVPSIEDMLALQSPRGFPFTAARRPKRSPTLLLVQTPMRKRRKKWDIHMRTRERELELEGV